MRQESVIDSAFLDDVKELILDAEGLLKRGKSSMAVAQDAVLLLENVTRLTLFIPTMESGSPRAPTVGPFGSSVSFGNSKGSLEIQRLWR